MCSETFKKCVTSLTDPACQAVELTLPKQVCKEINYGYAEDTPTEAEPVYEAPAPAYVAAPAPAGGQPRGVGVRWSIQTSGHCALNSAGEWSHIHPCHDILLCLNAAT